MTEQAPGHPVSIEIRTPGPLPVTVLHKLTCLVQGIADQLDAGTLIFGEHFRQEDEEFVFSFAGHAPTVSADDCLEDLDESPAASITGKDSSR